MFDNLINSYGVSGQNLQLLTTVVGLTIATVLFGVAVILVLVILRKVVLEKERYDLIAEQQELIWLDYFFHPQSLKVYGHINALASAEKLKMIGEEVYEIYDWVHPENASIRSVLRQFFDSGERYFKTELRIKKLDGEYGWYSLTGTLVKDKYHSDKNVRFVVRLENVDNKLTQEKDLLEKAETDLLTGIYNKKTMEDKTGNALENRKDNESYIFFMIDLDNFKSVNDTLGHIYGDQVLKEAAAKLKSVFPQNALIGRLGGDEFAVCACYEAFDASNLTKYMENKGEQLCSALKTSYCGDGVSVNVSSSIGIASAPGDGMDFVTIYQKADKALYLSKRSGKDCYNIFQKSDADE